MNSSVFTSTLVDRYTNPDRPLVSVITVVFNGENFIEDTIQSVLAQSYPKIEYIIIDGGSQDKTVEIIKKYQDKIAYWISEKDQGIYDAMNKGLAVASGKWVNFMNAGDSFVHGHAVNEALQVAQPDSKIIYGAVKIRYPEFERVAKAGCPNKLWQGMQFSHQSAFVDLKYHQDNCFDISNKIAADLHFFYKAYKSGAVFTRVDAVIAEVITGGVSELNRLRTISASLDAVCAVKCDPFIRLHFYGQILSSLIKTIAKKLLPAKVVKKIILSK